jgi:glycosyltransferase involved in cell wall biosynthesis
MSTGLAKPARWHLITGEYPPIEGGISDYSALVAAGLASAGHEVHVWTTGIEGSKLEPSGVTVHRSGQGWTGGDLARLGRMLDAFPEPRRLLVQYAPNAWGCKGMNLGFARWLVGRKRHGDQITAMIHEVCYIPNSFDASLIRRILPFVQKPMARQVLAAANRVFVSTPRWADLLRPLDPVPGRTLSWLPVPSTIPVIEDRPGVEAIRHRLAPGNETIVGSFGTFANAIGEQLARLLPGLLVAETGRIGLLIGRNSESFASRLIGEHPQLAGRLVATGGLDSEEISRHLQACDLMVQPYPDGICGRRTSFMAALAHGVAAISTEGAFTAPLWRESGAVALAPETDPDRFVTLALELLGDSQARAKLGSAGRDLYRSRFAIDRTIEALIGAD